MPQFYNPSLIFPEIQLLPQVLGEPRLRADVMRQITSDVGTNAAFQKLSAQEREAFLGFCMGNSSSAFHQYPTQYIHRSQFIFDTGMQAEQLENFIYIELDIFREMEHNEITELDAWMYFLGSDRPEDILHIIGHYPFFQELYQDIVKFRYQPKELITMFSDALRIMDQNAIEYMVDELKTEMARLDSELSKKTLRLKGSALC